MKTSSAISTIYPLTKSSHRYGRIRKVVAPKGKHTSVVYLLEFPAEPSLGHKRLRRTFCSRRKAEHARKMELSRRRRDANLLASLPREALLALTKAAKLFAALPPEARSCFRWDSILALVASQRQPLPLEEMLNRYLSVYRDRWMYAATIRTAARQLVDHFGATHDAQSLTSAEVMKWADQLRTKLRPTTVQTFARICAAAWTHSFDNHPRNPFLAVRRRFNAAQ